MWTCVLAALLRHILRDTWPKQCQATSICAHNLYENRSISVLIHFRRISICSKKNFHTQACRSKAPNAFGIFVRKPIGLPSVTALIRCIVKHQPVGGHQVATLHQRPMTVRELWNCKLHSFSFGVPFASGLTAVELHIATGGPDFNEGIDATETIHL